MGVTVIISVLLQEYNTALKDVSNSSEKYAYWYVRAGKPEDAELKNPTDQTEISIPTLLSDLSYSHPLDMKGLNTLWHGHWVRTATLVLPMSKSVPQQWSSIAAN